MTPIDIKIELIRAGLKQADIARRAGVTRQMVCQAISGSGRAAKVEQAIAAAIGKSVEDVFPLKNSNKH